MKLYLAENVYEAALQRIRRLFKEFPNVVVAFSGGKDSTVVLNLALQVAREMDRLPLKVFFIDQEAEWQTVIDYIRRVMDREEVEPLWLQCPIRIFNATSPLEPWLHCWDPEHKARWIREPEPDSLRVNRYGTDRFHKLFNAFILTEFPNVKTCILGGVRVEESPQRLVGLTAAATYKDITWGKAVKPPSHCIFYPLYDWSYRDIWKAIHDHGWDYCRVYDYMYQRGVPMQNMRVSNVHHETAVYSLFYLHELEPETWNRIQARIGGVNMAAQLNREDYFGEVTLPFMFASWREYRDYLLENLIVDADVRVRMAHKFSAMDRQYSGIRDIDVLHRAHVQTILLNDYEFTKLAGFEGSKGAVAYRRWKRGLPITAVKGKVHDELIPVGAAR